MQPRRSLVPPGLDSGDRHLTSNRAEGGARGRGERWGCRGQAGSEPQAHPDSARGCTASLCSRPGAPAAPARSGSRSPPPGGAWRTNAGRCDIRRTAPRPHSVRPPTPRAASPSGSRSERTAVVGSSAGWRRPCWRTRAPTNRAYAFTARGLMRRTAARSRRMGAAPLRRHGGEAAPPRRRSWRGRWP